MLREEQELKSRAIDAALLVVAEHQRKTNPFVRTGRELYEDLGKMRSGYFGNTYSGAVHKAAEAGKSAVGTSIGGLIGGALGSIGGGPLGSLISGAAGALIGYLFERFVGTGIGQVVGNAIELVGRGIAKALGIDFHSHGSTPTGGKWERVDHPDGSWERHESTADYDRDEYGGVDGSYEERFHGKGSMAGYDTDYKKDEKGSTWAAQAQDGIHIIKNSASGFEMVSVREHDIDKSNGKKGWHSNYHGKGGDTDVWNYDDGSSKVTNTSKKENEDGTTTTNSSTVEKDKHGHQTSRDDTKETKDKHGNTNTEKKHTDANGKTTSSVESKDAHGNKNDPPQPPVDKSGKDNPEGDGGVDRPRPRPGTLGGGVLGNPWSYLAVPGAWRRDNGDWDGEEPPRVKDLVESLVILMSPEEIDSYVAPGEDEGKGAALRRRLKKEDYGYGQKRTGEDFIHPKASAALLHVATRALLSN